MGPAAHPLDLLSHLRGRYGRVSFVAQQACYNKKFLPQGRSSVVEQRPFKPKVVGSIPTAPTNFSFVLNQMENPGGNKGALR